MINYLTLKLILTLLFIGTVFGDALDFSNKTITAILEKRFTSPITTHELLGYNFYEDKNETIFQIEILADIDDINDAILFSFRSISIIADISKTHFTHSVVVIHFINKSNPIIAKTDLDCSKEYFLELKKTESQWRNSCLSIQID
tara:strand:+ start:869 stop:1303 length:435 start_codon:yes stop_codon:yes gene_type:complete